MDVLTIQWGWVGGKAIEAIPSPEPIPVIAGSIGGYWEEPEKKRKKKYDDDEDLLLLI